MKITLTDKIPDEPGYYLFVGHRFPTAIMWGIYLVKVVKTTNFLTFICNDSFQDIQEFGKGKFSDKLET